MKKQIMGLIMAAALAFGATPLCAAEAEAPKAANPVEQFTGKYWVGTEQVAKEAYLFGIESAIEVEYFVNEKMAEKAKKAGRKSRFTLSPFERDWMAAFKDVSRKQIVDEVDKWYAAHPDELAKPVLTVIWEELIVPRIESQKSR